MADLDERLRALVTGSAASAARLGLDVTACPYAAQGAPRERTLARLWVSAFLAARPPMPGAVDLDNEPDRAEED